MPEIEETAKKHYLSDMYLTNEAVKLLPNNEKLNNINQCEAPLLEKKINIEDNDLYEVKQPKVRRLHRKGLFVALIGTAIAIILTGSVIMTLYMSRGGRRIPICAVGEGYPLQEIQFPYMPENDYKYSKMSDTNLFGGRNSMTTAESNTVPELPDLPFLSKVPGPAYFKYENIDGFTTENPLIERNLDDDCEDGMTSYTIGSNIHVCAMHEEVKVDDMGMAVENCNNAKGHLPQTSNSVELKYIGGILKDLSSLTDRVHLSPILIKREAREDDSDQESSLDKRWSFYQAVNLGQKGAKPDRVGILCIRLLQKKDLGIFRQVENSMVDMMNKLRDRMSSVFKSSRMFGNQ